jgi:hypothetical protein
MEQAAELAAKSAEERTARSLEAMREEESRGQEPAH